uniref:Uncharacterized protein n=1 Tax=Avena sativa TaxID=4498 RepID=A0ACD5Y8A9_AVESA
MPKDLDDLVERPFPVLRGPFLAPPSQEEEVEETSFRVIWMACCKTKPVALIFSSSTGQWRGAASQSWGDLEQSFRSIWRDFAYAHHYAYGCIYWQLDSRGNLLVLHTRTMEFSFAEPPPGAREWKQIAIVEAGADGPAMFALADGTSSDLYYTIRKNNLWQAEKTISLGPGRHYIAGATERYLVLARNGKRLPLDMPDYQHFTLDIRTLQLERMCELKKWHIHEMIYTNFPPSFLSLPTV